MSLTHAPILYWCVRCCGCHGIHDAMLQQHLRCSRCVLPVLPPCCLLSNHTHLLQWQLPQLFCFISGLSRPQTPRHIPPLASPTPLTTRRSPGYMGQMQRSDLILEYLHICKTNKNGTAETKVTQHYHPILTSGVTWSLISRSFVFLGAGGWQAISHVGST